MVKPKYSREVINGVSVLRIKNHLLMAPGEWSCGNMDAYKKNAILEPTIYTYDNLQRAFLNTDWSNMMNRYLYFDHADNQASNFIGYIENPHQESDGLRGDVVVLNDEAQKALLLGMPFGISPRLDGEQDIYTRHALNMAYQNFSLVINPACKKTFLNSEFRLAEFDTSYVNDLPDSAFMYIESGGEKDSSGKTTPRSLRHLPYMNKEGKVDLAHVRNALARLNQVKNLPESEQGTIRTKLENILKEHNTMGKMELSEVQLHTLSKEEDGFMAENANEAASNETKETQQIIAETKNEQIKAPEVDSVAMYNHFFERLAKNGAIKGEFADYARKAKETNPTISFDEIEKSFNDEKRYTDFAASMTEKVEKKLSELETGKKLSQRSEDTVAVQTAADVDAGMMEYLKHLGEGASRTFTLGYVPSIKNGRRVFELASAVTANSSVYGDAASAYVLNPIQYVRKAIDAAKEQLMFDQVITEYQLPEGFSHMILPYKTKYIAASSWNTSSAEYAAGTEIAWTAIDNLNGVQATPTRYNYGIALSNDAIRKNALNLVEDARGELSYLYENAVDSAIIAQLLGTVDTSDAATLGATEMTNSVNGCQTIFGGAATDADNSISAGDILTTDLVAKARRLLMSTGGYYWNSNTWTKSAVTKNPWMPTASQPFVLFIAPEQEEALLKDSQFTNAAQYGGREVVLNGELGKYLGVKVVSTTKCGAIPASSEIYVTATQTTFDVASHLCGMVKSGVCGGFVWGQKPDITVFDWPNADQVRMKLSMSYAAKPVHSDAIVRIAVSDA